MPNGSWAGTLMVVVFAGALGAQAQCAGSRTTVAATGGVTDTPAGTTWTGSIGVTIANAREALGADAGARPELDAADAALRGYVAGPSRATQCRLRDALQAALAQALQAGNSPAVAAAAGGLGTAADMTSPGCSSGPGAQARVRAAFSGGSR